MNQLDNDRSRLAYSKARFTRDALLRAAAEQLDAQTQALYAILIAESWPCTRNSSTPWYCKMSQERLAERLKTSVRSVSRWLVELRRVGLVISERHSLRATCRYFLPYADVPRQLKRPLKTDQYDTGVVCVPPPVSGSYATSVVCDPSIDRLNATIDRVEQRLLQRAR